MYFFGCHEQFSFPYAFSFFFNLLLVRDLGYNYHNHSHALQTLNFKIEKGESVAIVGKNGSGKSTLLKLLSGLYEPTEGIIKINGINLSEIDDISYKKEISVLFQDFLKFEATLLENIQIGDVDKGVNKQKIKSALQSADVNFLKTMMIIHMIVF